MNLLWGALKWSIVVGAAALALTLLKPLLDRRYSPRWRYWAWLVMALMLLLGPLPWGELLPQSGGASPALRIEVPRMELTVSREEGVSLQRPEAFAPSGGTAVREAGPAEHAMGLDQALTAVWLFGAGAFLLYELLGTAFLRRRARRWSRGPGQETARVYEEVRREMGLRKGPPLRMSSRVSSPVLTGILRPCLLLPAENYGERELRFILRHELTHYRRRDLWYKLIVLLSNAVHWFNPLAYLLSREAARDIELTCDAQVVAGADAETRRAYSETLLASIHRKSGFGRSALTTHFYGGAEVMKERFRNILGKQGRKWGGIVLALTLLAMAVTACAVGVSQAAGPESLSREELDAWQEKLTGGGEQNPYLCRMYTDPSYVPSEELLESLESPGLVSLGSPPPDFTVVSGTANGDTVTLELEGWFTSNLTSATLTLVDGKPVSLTNPLYTAVEKMAWDFVNASNMAGQDVEIAERCIPNIYCSESFQLSGRDWYVWELDYWLKPADIGQVTLAGGMEERGGWIHDFYNAPVLIVSDYEGSYILDHTAAQSTKEDGYAWKDYVFAYLHTDIDLVPVLNGWPAMDGAFLESLANGHETWATGWEDVAISYAEQVLGIDQAPERMDILYQEKSGGVDYDECIVVQRVYSEYPHPLKLLLTHAVHDGLSFWQVTGFCWEDSGYIFPEEPENPADEPADIPVEAPHGYETQPGELTADELAAFTAWFNPGEEPTAQDWARNGLLRFPYESFDDIRHYLEILFYDAGEYVEDEAERAALEERMGTSIETDCTRLTREFIREFFAWNFAESIPEEAMSRTLEEDVSLPNLPDYDAFYLVHGDTMMNLYTFDRGVREADGTVKLYYTTDLWVYEDNGELNIMWDQPMCVTMGLTGNETWGVVSNTLAE